MLYTNVKGILTVSLNQNTKIQHISFKQVGLHRPVLTLNDGFWQIKESLQVPVLMLEKGHCQPLLNISYYALP